MEKQWIQCKNYGYNYRNDGDNRYDNGYNVKTMDTTIETMEIIDTTMDTM